MNAEISRASIHALLLLPESTEMAWIFKSAAARARHADFASRIEPSGAPLAESAVEPHLRLVPSQEADAQPVVEKSADVSDDTTAISADTANFQPSTRGTTQAAETVVPEKRSLDLPRHPVETSELYLDDETAGEIVEILDQFYGSTADLPADLFEGVDVSSEAPPPKHPGQECRTSNTFGHAQRMPAEDERHALWATQRETRGFDDTELWSLDDTFARYILPRLKAQRLMPIQPPVATMPVEHWHIMYDKIIRAFELLLPEGGGAWSRGSLTTRERAELQEGLDLFRKYFFALTC